MAWYIVKIETTKTQTRITIPKVLSEEARIKGGMYCKMRIIKDRTIEIKELDIDEEEAD
ncbi:unnamed protein product [marine sediment metagenome]|uniref:Uncharacterized protein n=1 Tax=marine sediment metagenome TaxID=412755 RepID=X1T6P8_9ZZZZ